MIAIKQETELMGILKIAMIGLFLVILFFSFVVPALKNTYGYPLAMNQSAVSGTWNY